MWKSVLTAIKWTKYYLTRQMNIIFHSYEHCLALAIFECGTMLSALSLLDSSNVHQTLKLKYKKCKTCNTRNHNCTIHFVFHWLKWPLPGGYLAFQHPFLQTVNCKSYTYLSLTLPPTTLLFIRQYVDTFGCPLNQLIKDYKYVFHSIQ